MALSTAGVGLYGKEALALPYPSTNPVRGGTILITGAASSVGCAAVQLARASGLDVIATASTRNHDMVKSLGATSVFDYNSPDAAKDIAAAIKAGSDFAGVFDAISSLDSFNQVGSILETVGPSKVAVVLPPPGQPGKNFEPAMGKLVPIPGSLCLPDVTDLVRSFCIHHCSSTERRGGRHPLAQVHSASFGAGSYSGQA